MLLNALTNYLSNQPVADASAGLSATAAPAQATDTPVSEDLKDLYQVSDRAVLISAVASEFDVTALSQEDLGQLQTRLQEYGLLNGRALTGMQYLFQAGAAQAGATQSEETEPHPGQTDEAPEQPQGPINALEVLENLRKTIAEQGGSFSFRQQVGQFHTLVSNLASARAH